MSLNGSLLDDTDFHLANFNLAVDTVGSETINLNVKKIPNKVIMLSRVLFDEKQLRAYSVVIFGGMTFVVLKE